MQLSKNLLPNIGVIGIGRIGLCYALLLDKAGYKVHAADIDLVYLQSLQQKKIRNNETDVCNLLASNHITFTDNIKEIFQICEIIYIMVPTPSNADGSYNISAVESIVSQMREYTFDMKEKILVIGCTMNPGDCKILEQQVCKYGVSLLYNPVFTAQGSIIKDLQQAEIVLIGGESERAIKKYQQIYFAIQTQQPNVRVLSFKAAEIVKIAVNCYLTTKISFANILGEILIMSQLENEIEDILDVIGTDTRIGKKFFKYGLGYGGPCLPRDNKALAHHSSKVGVDFHLGKTVDRFNNQHTLFLADFFIKKNKENFPFYFTHISYKPNIMDVEQSQLYVLCCKLLEKGFSVYVDASSMLSDVIKTSLQQKYKDLIKFVHTDDMQAFGHKIFRINI